MYSREFEAKCESWCCRSCGNQGLMPVLDLGLMPLVQTFVSSDQLQVQEKKYPLEVGFCSACSLMQVLQTVPPEEVFHQDYPYYSSFSDTLLSHSRNNVNSLIERRGLDASSLVVELASNDGYLLRYFVQQGIPVLGIDPAPGPAQAARKIGVPTICDFFGTRLARKLIEENQYADVVIANNVMAHVADINGFVAGIRMILKDDGVLVSESPYVKELIDRCEFDTIYHEHLCYYSVTALDRLFRRNGLFLNDIQPLSIHGGSLRIFVEKNENVSQSVKDYLWREQELGLTRWEYYRDFARKVLGVRAAMRQMLSDQKADHKRIAAYGAAAKGVVMLNYVGAGTETIDYVVDRNVHKQGMFMPGVRVPVCDPSRLAQDMPDYVLILPWNLKDEILSQQQAYLHKGGHFIVPIPAPQVI